MLGLGVLGPVATREIKPKLGLPDPLLGPEDTSLPQARQQDVNEDKGAKTYGVC